LQRTSQKRSNKLHVIDFDDSDNDDNPPRQRQRPSFTKMEDRIYHQALDGHVASQRLSQQPSSIDTRNDSLVYGATDLESATASLSDLSFLEPTKGVEAENNIDTPVLLQKVPRRKMDSVSILPAFSYSLLYLWTGHAYASVGTQTRHISRTSS
jgi:hypothetical protein